MKPNVSYNAQRDTRKLTDFGLTDPMPNKKGGGAHYLVKKPGALHLEILRILKQEEALSEDTAIPSAYIRQFLTETTSDSSYSGRLSECTAMGWIKQVTVCINVWEENGTLTFRYDKDGHKKPCHHITQEGLEEVQ